MNFCALLNLQNQLVHQFEFRQFRLNHLLSVAIYLMFNNMLNKKDRRERKKRELRYGIERIS